MEKKVIDLPKSDDKFWEGADTETIPNRPPVTCAKGEHEFKRVGHEGKCGCGVGYQLGPGMIVDRGHIYYFGQLMI